MGRAAVAVKILDRATTVLSGKKKRTITLCSRKAGKFSLQLLPHGLAAPPPYFRINAHINKEGYEALEAVIEKGLTALERCRCKSRIARR